jgi:hypothetical protein
MLETFIVLGVIMMINDIYNYVFGKLATIDVSNISQHRRNEKRKEIEKCIQSKFAPMLCDNNKDSFRALLREIHNTELEMLLFGNTNDNIPLAIAPFPSDTIIKDKFKELNAHYAYFSDSKATQSLENNFVVFFKGCKLQSHYIEDDKDEQLAYLNAYKILVLYGAAKGKNPFANIERFFKKYNLLNTSTRPLHDVLFNNLTVNNPAIHLRCWQEIIMKNGPAALALFQRAHELKEKKYPDPASFEEAKKMVSEITYQRFHEHPELAILCHTYNISENNFNTCLEIEKIRKHQDKLPTVVINGSELNCKGYYFVKLPNDDPRAYMLGYFTGCCQSIGRQAQQYVIDGVTHEYNGFYVLLKALNPKTKASPFIADHRINYKDFEIVGQCYMWLSQQGNLTIDSFESYKHQELDPIIQPILAKFGEVVTEQTDITRVTIGVGGGTPSKFNQRVIYPEEILEGLQHADSTHQALVYCHLAKVESMKAHLLQEMDKQGYFIFLDKDYFEAKCVNEDILTSPQIASWLTQLFLQQESYTFWQQWFNLYRERGQEKDAFSFIKQGPACWHALYLLKQQQLLTIERYQLIEALLLTYPATLFNHLFTLLNEANLLNDVTWALLTDLFKTKTNFPDLVYFINLLSQASCLNQKTLAAVFAHLDKAERNDYYLHQYLDNLEKEDILNESIFNLLISHSDVGYLLHAVLLIMKKENILNEVMLDFICQKPKSAGYTVDFILLLQHAGISPEPYLKTFVNRKRIESYALVRVFSFLSRAEIIQEDIVKLVLNQPTINHSIVDILSTLHSNYLLTSNNFNLVFHYQDTCADLAFKLYKLSEVGILDQCNFNLAINCEMSWQLFQELHTNHLLDDETFKLLARSTLHEALYLSNLFILLNKHHLLNKEIRQFLIENIAKIDKIKHALISLENSEQLNEKNLSLIIVHFDKLSLKLSKLDNLIQSRVLTDETLALLIKRKDNDELDCLLEQLHRADLLVPSVVEELEDLDKLHPLYHGLESFNQLISLNNEQLALLRENKCYRQDFFSALILLSKGDLLTQANLKKMVNELGHAKQMADELMASKIDNHSAFQLLIEKSKEAFDYNIKTPLNDAKKDVIRDFRWFYTVPHLTHQSDQPAAIIKAWAVAYIEKNNKNPFAILNQQGARFGFLSQLSTLPFAFFCSADIPCAVKLFGYFFENKVIPPSLKRMMSATLVDCHVSEAPVQACLK